MSRTLTRGLTALVMTGLATFGLTGVAAAETTCGYAGQPACLPATADKSAVGPGGTVTGTAGPVQSGESGPIILASTETAGTGAGSLQLKLSAVPANGSVAGGTLAAPVAVGRSAAPADVSLGQYTANAAGIIQYAVVIPKNTPGGTYTINLLGHLPTGAEVTYFVPITVTGAGSGGGLPFTGAEVGMVSAISVGLLAAGTAAVLIARRRRSTVTA